MTQAAQQSTQATTPRPSRMCPIPSPRPSKVTNDKGISANQYKQLTQVHPHPQPARKTPLLPTPPPAARQFNNRNHNRQFISRPSPPRYNINSTFPGPLTFNNNRFHQQPHIPEPHQQGFFTRPYPQPQGHQSPANTILHFIPQVSYIPVLLPHTNHIVTPWQYTYAA